MTTAYSGKNFIFNAFAMSDIGRRKNNEDAYLVNMDTGLFIVADGMGGHEKGEVASWFTSANVEKLLSAAKYHREDTLDEVSFGGMLPDQEETMKCAVLDINLKLYNENEKQAAKFTDAAKTDAEKEVAAFLANKQRMGTTLVSMLVVGNRVYITNIGDSRAYRIDTAGITRLTEDHSWIGERIHDGEILSSEAGAQKKKNLITRSVGIKRETKADIAMCTLHPPERYLLCSDGLCGAVDDESILALARTENLREACEKMVALAKERGGRDNITALIVDVAKQAAKGPAADMQGDDTIL